MKVTMSIAVGTFVVLFLQLETPMAQLEIQSVLLILLIPMSHLHALTPRLVLFSTNMSQWSMAGQIVPV